MKGEIHYWIYTYRILKALYGIINIIFLIGYHSNMIITTITGICRPMIITDKTLNDKVIIVMVLSLKSLKFMIEFQLPSIKNREILWEKLMPSTLPLREEINYK